ncbi:MAG: hypothetical protein II504_04620 [Clostridia bacterium]|nr:hypothetical protein [Clostridia bacterium]
MEALLDIFDPGELAELGYRERVIAYLKKYGCDEDIQTILLLIGAGLGIWGVVNLLEGYGNDNRATRSLLKRQRVMAGA